ncbi:hypothetical protein [Marinobacter sp. DS40M6]|uniref:hypothetical protein n=1 Tax=Marinobacter sp. DS40M6 TaxID=1597776 RepID=UPI0023584994|nr:hypothetical protein [Marinobacter sp. DS40M6]MDC8457823.1 hypothetical protein [Marinobacter sp. DS40M6]
MADSKRLTILKALTEHLEATPDYALTGKVWRGRNRPAQESHQPFLILFEMPPEFEERADRQVQKMPWYIGIQGYVEPDKTHPTDPAHQFMAAIKQQIGKLLDDGGAQSPPPEYMLNDLVEDIRLDGGMCFEPDETTNCCFFAMKLTLTVVENLGDPYA